MTDDQICPLCGGELDISTKDEAGYCKYWFVCLDFDDCRWESRTFRGPNVDPDESRVEREGYDRVMDEARMKALKEAKKKSTENFYT